MKIRYLPYGDMADYIMDKDPLLKPIFATTKVVEFDTDDDYFRSLMGSIVTQQLSGKVAMAIYKRLLEKTGGEVKPELVASIPLDELKDAGLSMRKAEYLHGLALKFRDEPEYFNNIDTMSDMEVIGLLSALKGIGRWTAEMFLMFTLGRMDVFSAGDYGLRKALAKLYGREIEKEEAEALSEKWKPYRSVVSHFLWNYLR